MFIDIIIQSMNGQKLQNERKIILVVDSSLVVRRMICFVLQGCGYEIYEAADGNEAVRIVCSQPVDLLITSMTLPGLNGLELSQIVRETRGLEDIPIIMLTPEDHLDPKNEARKVGVSLLISKPFNQAQIYNLVKEVLA
jgi:CheY-like chemotaxis protein